MNFLSDGIGHRAGSGCMDLFDPGIPLVVSSFGNFTSSGYLGRPGLATQQRQRSTASIKDGQEKQGPQG